MTRIPKDFFLRSDVVKISKELICKKLVTEINGIRTSGIITETEAYRAPEDKASHAYNNRKTERTKTFFAEGGVAYVYLCYGIHNLFNIVTNKADIPHAILIRAIKPEEGIDEMLKRRNKSKLTPALSVGPGSLSQALGITRAHNEIDLTGNTIWLEEGIAIKSSDIEACKRVGINYAEEYVHKLWRFKLKNSVWTCK